MFNDYKHKGNKNIYLMNINNYYRKALTLTCASQDYFLILCVFLDGSSKSLTEGDILIIDNKSLICLTSAK